MYRKFLCSIWDSKCGQIKIKCPFFRQNKPVCPCKNAPPNIQTDIDFRFMNYDANKWKKYKQILFLEQFVPNFSHLPHSDTLRQNIFWNCIEISISLNPSTGVVSGIIKRLRELQTPPRLFKLVAGEIGKSCLKNRTAEFKILTSVLLRILMKY